MHVSRSLRSSFKIYKRGKIGESYNIGSNQNLKNINIAKKLLKIAKNKSYKVVKNVKIKFVKIDLVMILDMH